MRNTFVSLGLAAAAALAGCTQAPEPTPGARLFAEHCAGCHGADARGGTTPVGGKLPPDLTTLARRHGGAFPSDYVMSTIDGYNREKTHGPMPVFGEILASPVEIWVGPDGELIPTPRALIELDEYLQGQQTG